MTIANAWPTTVVSRASHYIPVHAPKAASCIASDSIDIDVHAVERAVNREYDAKLLNLNERRVAAHVLFKHGASDLVISALLHTQTRQINRWRKGDPGARLLAGDFPTRPAKAKPGPHNAYWENRGLHDWRPVTVICRYLHDKHPPPQPFPHVTTKPKAPQNVTVLREDGTAQTLPIASLRRREAPETETSTTPPAAPQTTV